MKDLYTFDYNMEEALETYISVRNAYTKLFDELKIPYLVAAADSGNMGGSLSHEFHFPSAKGEDKVISCIHCDSVYNEELADGKAKTSESEPTSNTMGFDMDSSTPLINGNRVVSTDAWLSVSKDRRTLVRGWYPKYMMLGEKEEPIQREVNPHAVKSIAEAAGIDLDLGVENPLEQWSNHLKQARSTQRPAVLDIYDRQVRVYKRPPLSDLLDENSHVDVEYSMLDQFPGTNYKLSIVKACDGDMCSKCGQGSVKSSTSIELGHTFHLGTRYSEVLGASVAAEESHMSTSKETSDSRGTAKTVPMQMGCHGIGVSRMVTAVADKLSDSKGLNWPRVIAPFEVVVVPVRGLEKEAEEVYDRLSSINSTPPVDVLLDDRHNGVGWKLGDADMIGYPVIIVVGRGYRNGTCEVQCRRLDNLKEDVPLDQLYPFVSSLLDRL